MVKKSNKSKNKQTSTSNSDQGKSPYIVALSEIFEIANRNPNNRPGFSPLSGSEPKYDPHKWNDNPRIKRSHNCYAYVLDRILSGRKAKPQPGTFSGYPPLTDDDYDCDTFYKRIKKDNPSLYKIKFEERCRKGFHKGFLALADKAVDKDYHFYRQDEGLWSSKPGSTEISDIDASGKKIINPALANRNYPSYQYKTPCFFFCVNPSMTRAHS